MTTFYIANGRSSGIDVTYIKRRNVIRISGWYDTCVGIEGQEFDLQEFLDKLGVRKSAIQKVLQTYELRERLKREIVRQENNSTD